MRDLRSRLTLVVALAAAPSCSSAFPDDCPHLVLRKTSSVTIDAAAACAVASEQVTGQNQTGLKDGYGHQRSSATAATCQRYCKDGTINGCFVPQDFVAAFNDANPSGLPPAVVTPTCPLIPNGGMSVTLTCQETDWEGVVQKGCPVEGRRPEGLLPAHGGYTASAIGAYFAECAHLEAASVIAFRTMRAELVAHGAPDALVRAAERAEREEIRHTELARSLAERFGGVFEEPCAAEARMRSMAEIAIENVVEGIVRETYGAVVALWRAEHASDEDVRCAMREIAEDECRHAALSWDVAKWVRARLDDVQRAALDVAMRAAIDELTRDVAAEPARVLREVAGVPSACDATRLVAELERAVWSAAA